MCSNVFKCVEMCSNVFKCVQMFKFHEICGQDINIRTSTFTFLVLYLQIMLRVYTILLMLILPSLIVPCYRWNRSKKPWSLMTMIYSACIKISHMGGMCLDVEAARDNLELFADIMERHSIKFWLSEGTALGAIREGRFIPHDDDIDVAINDTDHQRFFNDAFIDLEKSGFVIAKVWNDGNFITFIRRGEALDVDFVKDGRPCMFLSRGKFGLGGTCADVESYITNLRRISFYDRDYWCPSDDYLVHQYGPDWKTPITSRCDA